MQYIDWNKYKNNTPYVYRQSFIKKRIAEAEEKNKDLPLTRSEFLSRVQEAKEAAEREYSEYADEQCKENKRLLNLFWEDMRKYHEYGDMPPLVVSLIEGQAWERAHSGGFQEVHNELYDIVTFVRKVIEAVKESV